VTPTVPVAGQAVALLALFVRVTRGSWWSPCRRCSGPQGAGFHGYPEPGPAGAPGKTEIALAANSAHGLLHRSQNLTDRGTCPGTTPLAVVSDVLGRTVTARSVDDGAMRATLASFGRSRAGARPSWHVELREGCVAEQPRTPATMTGTTPSPWAWAELRPALQTSG